DIEVDGYVQFRPATANRGTILFAKIHYRTPKGAVGFSLAKILGKDPSFLMRQDLRRLKALIETGEIPTIEGQTHGPRSAVAAAARVVDPDQPIRGDVELSELFRAKRRVA
ncbi:MAG: cyclase/dehydrase, partial [Candidatus Angelobacter sp.]|nr:cyclase/dehydrase [Candidatus Angelobacter sp.]